MPRPRTLYSLEIQPLPSPTDTHVDPYSPRPGTFQSEMTLHMPECDFSRAPSLPPTPFLKSRFDVNPYENAFPTSPVSLDLEKQVMKKSYDMPPADPWDSDPENPRTWSFKRKWAMAGIISLYTFVSPLASSMMAPGLEAIQEHYHIGSPTVVALTLSIYLLAFAVGPLLLGPLSEIYGRAWVLHLSNIWLGIFCGACVFAPNTGALIAFRFLAGLGGGAPTSIGGAVIGDLFHEKERATAMSIYTLGPLLGPVVGPIAGGFMVETIGFRYIFVGLAGFCALSAVIGIPLLRETYAPVIQARQAKRQVDPEATIHEHVGARLSINIDAPPAPPEPSIASVLRVNLTRPLVLLSTSFICFILSLFMAVNYGYLYLLFTAYPTLFKEIYGWDAGISGLAYIGPGVGFLLSTSLGAPLMTKIYSTLTARNGGVSKPEFRIPSMMMGSAIVPVGLLWYGWSAEARLHWIMPIIGGGIFTTGMMLIYIPIQLYLVDSFKYAASALAAAATFRCMLAFAFPLFGDQLFAALGYGGGNSLLAGVAIFIGVPFPIWIYYRGEQMRARSDLNR